MNTNRNKRILSLLLALIMIILTCASPVSVQAKQVEKTKITSAVPSNTSVKLKWKKKKNAKFYQIKYSENASFKPAKTVKVSKSKKSRTIKKLTPGVRYYFKIRYKTDKGYSKWSKKKSCCSKPLKVSITSAEAVSDSSIKLKWKKIDKSSGYIIYYSNSPSFSDNKYVKISSNAETQYVLQNISPASSYFVKMRSYKNYGKKVAYSDYSEIYSLSTSPAKVVISSITSDYNSAIINITPVQPADGYELNYSKDESFEKFKGFYVNDASDTQFVISDLEEDCKYYIRIRSYVKRGNAFNYSEFTYDSFTDYSEKVEITDVVADYNSAEISYNALNYCSGFELDYSVSSDFNNYKRVKITDLSKSTYKLNELKSEQTFYIRLLAYYIEGDKTLYSDYAYSSFETAINEHSFVTVKPNVAYNGTVESFDEITTQEYTSEPDYYSFEKNGYKFNVPAKLYFNNAPDENGYYRTDYSVTVEMTDSEAAEDIDEILIYPDSEKVKMTLDDKPYAKADFSQETYRLSKDDLKNKASLNGEICSYQIESLHWSGEAVINIAFKSSDIIYRIPENANYIYVSADGDDENGDGSADKPYKSIYYANSVISDNGKDNPYVIKVSDGVYNDLNELYYGTVSSAQYRGYICKDYVYYIGNVEHPENVVINYDAFAGVEDSSLYTNTNCDKCDVFHIFNSRHTSIQGFTINSRNTNYSVHIETTGTSVTSYSLVNCIINYYGHPNISNGGYYNAAIGCGSTYGEKGYFKNCVINNSDEILLQNSLCYTVHSNTTNPSVNGGADIMFEDCEFQSLNSTNIKPPSVTFGASTYSASQKTNNVYLINCKGVNSERQTRIKGTYNNLNYDCFCFKTDYYTSDEINYNEFEKASFERGSFGYSGYSNSTKQLRSCLIPVKHSSSYSVKLSEEYKIYFIVAIKDETTSTIMRVGSGSGQNATVSTGPDSANLLIVVSRTDGAEIDEADLNNKVILEITQTA